MVEKPVQSFVGSVVWHGPSTVPGELDATYAADALGTVVAEPSSRFQKSLVDSGACVSANLSWYTQRNVGPISLRFQAAPDKIDTCVRAVFKEIDELAKPGYVTPDELASAAHTLEIDQIKEREKPSSLAHVITFWWASAGLDYYLGYVDNVKKVTPDDTTRFVTTYMKGKPYVFGALVSPEMSEGGTTQAHLESLTKAGGK